MDDLITINVNPIFSDIFTVKIAEVDKIKALKESIIEKIGIPKNEQYLIHFGRILNDTETILESKIFDGDMVTVTKLPVFIK